MGRQSAPSPSLPAMRSHGAERIVLHTGRNGDPSRNLPRALPLAGQDRHWGSLLKHRLLLLLPEHTCAAQVQHLDAPILIARPPSEEMLGAVVWRGA